MRYIATRELRYGHTKSVRERERIVRIKVTWSWFAIYNFKKIINLSGILYSLR